MGEKLGKIIKEEEQQQPMQQAPMPQQPYPQQPYPPQPMAYPPQFQQPPPQYNYPPMPPAIPMIQGDLIKTEKITQDKKDWILLDIIVDAKFAHAFRIGKISVIQ